MGNYTKKEFAAMCKIKTSDLSNYIARGKVILTGELINSELETNQYFYESRIKYYLKKHGGAPIEGERADNPAPEGTENRVDVEPSTGNVELDPEQKKLNDRVASKDLKEATPELKFPAEHPGFSQNSKLDHELKQEQLKKDRLNTALLQAKLDKQSGDSIPTELVKNLFIQHSKSITVAFRNGAENLLIAFSKRRDCDAKETADMRAQLFDVINASVEKSIVESKKALNHIIAEHSQKKEVGERE
jgi:antitoxin component of MazEF toxin-antitoxin module